MRARIWKDGYYQILKDVKQPLPQDRDNDFKVRLVGRCNDCKDLIIPEYDEPFAHCSCSTTEWYQ